MAPAGITEPLLRVLSRSPIRLLVLCAAGVLLMTTATVATPSGGSALPALGRIEGVVRLVAPLGSSAPIASGAYPTRRVSRPAARASEISNVVVFVKDGPRAGALAPVRAQMVQQDESFLPRLVAITRGSTVDFPNGDPFFHDVFSLSRSATFDLGGFRAARAAPAVHAAGLVKVYCHLHSHMSGEHHGVRSPSFHRCPQVDGSFVIEDVPAGTYHLSAWHERIGETASRSSSSKPGRHVEIEFALPIETQ